MGKKFFRTVFSLVLVISKLSQSKFNWQIPGLPELLDAPMRPSSGTTKVLQCCFRVMGYVHNSVEGFYSLRAYPIFMLVDTSIQKHSTEVSSVKEMRQAKSTSASCQHHRLFCRHKAWLTASGQCLILWNPSIWGIAFWDPVPWVFSNHPVQ